MPRYREHAVVAFWNITQDRLRAVSFLLENPKGAQLKRTEVRARLRLCVLLAYFQAKERMFVFYTQVALSTLLVHHRTKEVLFALQLQKDVDVPDIRKQGAIILIK